MCGLWRQRWRAPHPKRVRAPHQEHGRPGRLRAGVLRMRQRRGETVKEKTHKVQNRRVGDRLMRYVGDVSSLAAEVMRLSL